MQGLKLAAESYWWSTDWMQSSTVSRTWNHNWNRIQAQRHKMEQSNLAESGSKQTESHSCIVQFYSEPEPDMSKLTFDKIVVPVSQTFFVNKLASMIEK